MSKKRTPILLSFYGLSNGKQNLFFGKVAYSPVGDLSFKDYNRFKTFKTIIALYRTRGIHNREFEMAFDHGSIKGKTDHSGSFWCDVAMDERQTKLVSITLNNPKEEVWLTENLYPNTIHRIQANTLVISDLDDTLIHSFIHNKFKQLRTLLFTSVENRKTVTTMANLIGRFVQSGATPFYLSNSEQNLFPMLFRFLALNKFPAGPLFLKQYIGWKQLVWRKKFSVKNLHKLSMLEKILDLFPDKQYILIGDNTQHDLAIYLEAAEKYPHNIRYIIIREVSKKPADKVVMQQALTTLQKNKIGLHYSSHFPEDIPWDLQRISEP